MGGNSRVEGGQVVEPCQHFFASANGAAAAVDAAGDASLVVVAFLAAPPDFAPGAGNDVGWGELPVFGGVPFFCQSRIKTLQVIVTSLHLFVIADGAPCAVDTGFDLRLPLMAFITTPPHQPMAARQHLIRRERTVFFIQPFLRQIGIFRSQIIFSDDGQPSGTIWASRAGAVSGMNSCSLAVSICTTPPNMFFAAIADAVRCERQIASAVPFIKQIFSARTTAIICQ